MVDEPSLHDRVKELWGKNLTQMQMLDILTNEGFTINKRQLARLRQKDGLRMRLDAPDEQDKENEGESGEGLGDTARQIQQPASAIPMEIQYARQARQAKLWAESAERLKNRSRRRRIRGWAGLPPDPGQPPRFPSELTLEESRNLLYLDRSLYKEIRCIFQKICETHDVIRKAGCAPGVWQYVKDELVDQSPHLQAIFRTPRAAQMDPNKEPTALDVICMDTTKAMRVATKAITLTDAKNILGLTPDEARGTRSVFDNILRANYYINRRDVTKEEWEGYKQQWIQQSPRLQQEFQTGEDGDVLHQKQRALEMMARDVQKRKRDTDAKRDTNASNKRKAENASKSTSPKKQKVQTPATVKKAKEKLPSTRGPDRRSSSGRPPWMPSTPPPGTAPEPNMTVPPAPPHPFEQQHNLASLAAAAEIDPKLLAAAALPDNPVLPEPPAQPPTHTAPPPPPSNPAPSPTPIYIRLSPSTFTRYPNLPKVWLDHFHHPYTVNSLKIILDKRISKLQVRKIEGLADGATVDNELGSRWDIDDDDEVEAYINYVRDVGGKVVFVVDVV